MAASSNAPAVAGGAPGAAHAAGPAAAMPANPAAMAPGAGSGPAGGIGGGAAPQFAPGTAESALLKFCTAMAESNLTEAGQYVSPKAKGVLAQIRDGSITDEKIESLKESFSLQGLTLKPTRPIAGVGKNISLGNAKQETLSFTLMKEDDGYLLRDFKVSKSAK